MLNHQPNKTTTSSENKRIFFRGYTIRRLGDGGYEVGKGSVTAREVASMEEALDWIDTQRPVGRPPKHRPTAL